MAPKVRKDRRSGGASNSPAGFNGTVNTAVAPDLKAPILHYAEGRGEIMTNIVECKEVWSIVLLRTYGNAGRLLDLGKWSNC